MSPCHLVTLSLLALPAFAERVPPLRLTLSRSDDGKVPTGWITAHTGDGAGTEWKVVADATTPSGTGYALAQTGVAPNLVYNLCVANRSSFDRNLVIGVSLKAVKGDKDQGGGVCWLYQDEKNYYICRYNPLEENLRLYHIKDGKRTQLATKEEVKARDGGWYKLRVTHLEDRILCTLDDKHTLEVKDATLTKPGKVGLWTKADARTHFDGFEATTVLE